MAVGDPAPLGGSGASSGAGGAPAFPAGIDEAGHDSQLAEVVKQSAAPVPLDNFDVAPVSPGGEPAAPEAASKLVLPAATALAMRDPTLAIARVAGRVITASELAAEARTLEGTALLADAYRSFGSSLGVASKADESLDSLVTRVRAAAEKAGPKSIAALDRKLGEVDLGLQKQALMRLIDVALFRSLASDGKLDLSKLDGLSASEQHALARSLALKVIAKQLGVPADSRRATEALDEWKVPRGMKALWAPGAQEIDRALGGLPASDRESARAYLASVYESAGLFAPAQILQDLRADGPAAWLCRLLSTAKKTNLTVEEVEVAIAKEPVLARLKAPLDAARTATRRALEEAQLTREHDDLTRHPVRFRVTSAGLMVGIDPSTSRPKLFDAIKAGKLKVAYRQGAEGPVLALLGAKDALPPGKVTEDALKKLDDDIVEAGRALQVAFAAGYPPFAEVLAGTGLTDAIGPAAADLVRENLGAVAILSRSVVWAQLEGQSHEAVVARLKALKIPEPLRETLRCHDLRLRGLLARTPLPSALAELALGKAPMTPAIPLKLGGNASSDLLAGLQRFLVQTGDVEITKISFGRLDETTLAALKKLAKQQAEVTKTEDILVIDQDLVQDLLARAADKLQVNEVTSGELILGHPALRQHAAHGGKASPPLLLAAYLDAQGYRVSLSPTKFDAAFFTALYDSLHKPVSAQALAAAEAKIADLAPLSAVELERAMATRLVAAGTIAPVVISVGQITGPERRALMVRLAALSRPVATQRLDRSELGHLAQKEPLVALKLAAIKLAGGTVPPGPIQRRLSPRDLRVLSAWRFESLTGVDTSAAAWARWQDLIAHVEAEGDLCNLSQVLAGDSKAAKAWSKTRQELLELAKIVRAYTVQTDAADEAVRGQIGKYDPIETFPQPFAKARAVIASRLGEPEAQGTALFVLSEHDLDRLDRLSGVAQTVAVAQAGNSVGAEATAFLLAYKTLAPSLAKVRAALTEGRLQVHGGRFVTKPEDERLADLARQAVALYARAADLLQAEARQTNDGATGNLVRTGLKAAFHFGRMPGFADKLAINAVNDWTVLALKIERHQKAGGPDPSVIKPGEAPLEKLDEAHFGARMETVQIDAALLEYVLATYPKLIGRGFAENAIGGDPPPVLPPDEARKLLERMAREMKAGQRAPWPSANMLPGDKDDVRIAKTVLQATLRQRHGGPDLWSRLSGTGRDAHAVTALAERLVGLDGPALAPFIKSAAIQQGLIDVKAAGPIDDAKLNAKMIEATLVLANKMAAIHSEAPADARADIAHCIAVLADAAKRKAEVSLAGPVGTSELERAVRRIAGYAAGVMGASGRAVSFDFAEMLAKVPGDILVSGPIDNAAGLAGNISLANLRPGGEIPAGEAAKAMDAWKLKEELDLRRTGESFAGNLFMFTSPLGMRMDVSYDLSVAPLSRLGQAGHDYFTGATPKARADAKKAAYAVAENYLIMQVMFFGYRIGVSFLQQVKDAYEHGDINAAVGAGAVLVPLGLRSVRDTARGYYRRFVPSAALDGHILQVDTAGRPWTFRDPSASVPSEGHAVSPARDALAKAYRGAGAFSDVVLDPKVTVERAIRAGVAGVEGLLGAEISAQGANAPQPAWRLHTGMNVSPGASGGQLNIHPWWAEEPLEPLRKLVDPARVGEVKIYTVTLKNGTTFKLPLANEELARLCERYFSGKSLNLSGELAGKEQGVRALLNHYRNTPLNELKGLSREAAVFDAKTRVKAKVHDKAAFIKSLDPREIAGNAKTAWNDLKQVPGDVKTRVQGALDGLTARITDELEQRAAANRGEAPATNAPAPAQAAASAVAAVKEAEGARRDFMASAEAAVRAANAKIASEGGATGYALKLTRSVVEGVKGQVRTPGFSLVVLLAGREVLLDVFKDLNDKSVDRIHMAGDLVWSLSKNSAIALGGLAVASKAISKAEARRTALLEAGKRVGPRILAPLVHGASAAGLASLVPSLVDGSLYYEMNGAARGHEPLPSLRFWQQMLPEAAYLKVDPARYSTNGLPGVDPLNDIETIENGNGYTLRTGEIYFNERSTLHERLRRVLGRPADASVVDVLRKADKFDVVQGPAQVTHYEEPIYPQVTFLQNLDMLRGKAEASRLAAVPYVKKFKYAAFRAKIETAAPGIIRRVTLDGGKVHFVVDEAALKAMLAEYSIEKLEPKAYAALPPAKKAEIEAQLAAECLAVKNWAALFVSGMSISPNKKFTELKKTLINVAANKLVNTMMFRVAQDYSENIEGRSRTDPWVDPYTSLTSMLGPDDYYLLIARPLPGSWPKSRR